MNIPATIQPYTWLQSITSKKFYVVAKAYWGFDDSAGRWLPTGIELLEYKATKTQSTTCHELCEMIEKGEMVVVACPV